MSFEAGELHPERSNRDMFGYELRWHRTSRGMSLQALAEVVNFSKSHLARIETAESMAPEDLPAKLDAFFETNGIFGRLYERAKREDLPFGAGSFLKIAAEAILYESCSSVIPGLLQTSAFARAIFACGDPYRTVDQLDRSVMARLSRQERLLLTPHQCEYWFILDEVALRRPVGTAATMRDQLASLQDRANLANVTVQILPFSAGEYAEMGTALTVLTLPDHSLAAYLEGSRSGRLEESPSELLRLRRSYNVLRAKALSPAESLALISEVREDYQRHAGEDNS
jgi:transcriptional regulator with XRE-family HTH domain